MRAHTAVRAADGSCSIVVKSVTPGGNAAGAGLCAGDEILSVNSVCIENASLCEFLEHIQYSDRGLLLIVRQTERQSTKVKKS